MAVAVSVGVAAGIGALCFLLGFVLRHFCTATSEDSQKVACSQPSNPLAAVFVPVKSSEGSVGSVGPFSHLAQQPESRCDALGAHLSTAQHSSPSTTDGEVRKRTAQRSKQLSAVEEGGKAPRGGAQHSAQMQSQHSARLPRSHNLSQPIESESGHGDAPPAPYGAIVKHAQHASHTQLEHSSRSFCKSDSQQALDAELCEGGSQHAQHMSHNAVQEELFNQQFEHSAYYSSTSQCIHSPEFKPGPSNNQHAPTTPQTPAMGATSDEPAVAAGLVHVDGGGTANPIADSGTHTVQAPEDPARLPDSNLNHSLNSIQTASTNMRSMRSMWSCMGNVQRVVGPVVYCMQASASSIEQSRERLHALLDELCARRHPLGGRLMMLADEKSRYIGGHSTVQIARHTITQVTYALKFFLCPAAFQHAKTLYTDGSKPLGHFLPALARMHEAGELTGVNGDALPACIIMQPGESLDLFMGHKRKLDLITCLKVLCHASGCLRVLHGAGYVHRDVNPGNLMWMPRKRHWTLIGFACATAAGSKAALTYNIAYAAPEILKAVLDGEETMRVAPAVDAWALGIVAIELLSGESVFDRKTISTEQAVGMIVGRKTAPWEDRNSSTAALLTPLGEVKAIVLRLLCRDPRRRMNMEQCFEACLFLLKQSTQRATSQSLSRSRSDFQEQLFRLDHRCTQSESGALIDAQSSAISISNTVR